MQVLKKQDAVIQSRLWSGCCVMRCSTAAGTELLLQVNVVLEMEAQPAHGPIVPY